MQVNDITISKYKTSSEWSSSTQANRFCSGSWTAGPAARTPCSKLYVVETDQAGPNELFKLRKKILRAVLNKLNCLLLICKFLLFIKS